MAVCPSCRRPVAVARDRCLYCAQALPAELLARPRRGVDAPGRQATGPPDPPDLSADRSLLVVDLRAASAQALGAALSLSSYEADLLARRGGFHLYRILDPQTAETERERLAAAGLSVEVLPEREVRVAPSCAVGGVRGNGLLTLRTDDGPVTVRSRDLLLVVGGPIARQYQPSYRGRRVDTASLDEGFRVHLHRLSDQRPLEIDSANFEFGAAVRASTLLELEAWLEEVGDGVPRDDGFRRLPPAFGLAAPETRGPLAAAAALGRAHRAHDTREGESVLLDNAAQFRFYSAWRAALERRHSPRLRTPPVLG